MSRFEGISSWSVEGKLSRLKELGLVIRSKEYATADVDESVVIFLELFREVVGYSPMQFMFELIEYYKNPGETFVIMKNRFLDTFDLVERFKVADKHEKMRLRPTLKARGML